MKQQNNDRKKMKTLFLPIEKSKWNRNLCTKCCKYLRRKEKKYNEKERQEKTELFKNIKKQKSEEKYKKINGEISAEISK